MNSVTPTSAMSRGGTFMRPGAMAWGHGAQGDPAVQDPATPALTSAERLAAWIAAHAEPFYIRA